MIDRQEFFPHTFTANDGFTLPYQLRVPKGSGPFPLFLCMHGAGERGVDNQCTFVKDGTQENIFTPSPSVGDAPYYKVVDGELIIDNTTLSGLINYLGHVMVVDYDAKTVTIV